MSHAEEDFQEAFSRFVRQGGRWRNCEPEALLAVWAHLVAECERGYRGEAVEDYFNDLTSRGSLEAALSAEELQHFPQLAALRAEVESIDTRFRAILRPDVFPKLPHEEWWARGMVRYARQQLVDDMREQYGVEIDLLDE